MSENTLDLDLRLNLEGEKYYKDTSHVSNSMLGLLRRSPRHLWHYMAHPEEQERGPALIFGEAFHCAVLEPDKFERQWLYMPKFDRRTKQGKIDYEEWMNENKDCKIISRDDYDKIIEMRTVLYSHKEVKELLALGEAEKVHTWETRGIKCKAKADKVHKDDFIVDLKTTTDATKNMFVRNCDKLGYKRQAAFYMDGFGVEFFYFIAIEKERPYSVAVYECGKDFLQQGRDEYNELLNEYRKYFIDKELSAEDYIGTGIL